MVRQESAWEVLDDCPAPRHNLLIAARGDGGKPKCVCPYAIKLLDRYRTRRHERLYSSHQVGRPRRIENRAAINPLDARGIPEMTDLRRGACRTTEGMKTMDRYADNPTSDGYERAARMLCDVCPVLAECGQWVRKAERPAGSWHVMVAGLTRLERVRAGKMAKTPARA